MPSQLTVGQSLQVNDKLVSPDGRFTLTLQSDGNLVLYSPEHTSLWASNTNGNFAIQRATLQTDCNFVLYDNSGHSLWSSETYNVGFNPYLSVQDDGNVVIYATHSQWATNTAT